MRSSHARAHLKTPSSSSSVTTVSRAGALFSILLACAAPAPSDTTAPATASVTVSASGAPSAVASSAAEDPGHADFAAALFDGKTSAELRIARAVAHNISEDQLRGAPL